MSESLDTKITMNRGDNFDRLYKFKKLSDSSVYVLTGAEIILTVRKGTNSPISFQLKNTAATGGSDEIEDVDLDNGQFIIHIVPINTASMLPGLYIYDIQIKLAGKTKTYVKNMFKLEGDMTN